MVVKVYCWEAKDSFGHFAVKLTDDTYLSFWPLNQYDINDANNLRHTASRYHDDSNEDRLVEGRVQDEIIEIQKDLDEQKIKDFWEANKTSTFGMFNNCAIMTFKLIEAGGIDENDPE
ncbi:unnamed protein product [Oppiella nova]|uniref:Uncharacterized protein n=1 Tax=Oppiella nova TaxID=334625 RepID=A0A7R9LTM3_9ACAR|nr:unnamed protein product [Oppiella nova]CAG2166538.1 unnamed protein product [Oppiella nova]